MSLKGHLEVFPLEEVLRLLARSKKSGCLRVESAMHVGRVFMAGGAISFATVGSDDYLRRQVVNAGLVDAATIDAAGSTPLPESLAEGVKASALSDFIREEVVESLYRIRKAGAGSFEFDIDIAPAYPTGQSFDADVVVSEADRRAVEWLDVDKVFADLAAPLRMTYTLPDENEATITPAAWKLLARLEAGHSIDDLSATLGVSRYRAAREIADQMRAGRVELIPTASPEPVYEPVTTEWGAAEPASEHSMWTTDVDDSMEAETPLIGSELPAFDEPQDQEWTPEEPEALVPVIEETGPVAAVEAEEESEEASEDASTATDGGWWAQAMGDPSKSNASAEADAFLESVFGELDSHSESDPNEPDQGFGVGLLRRRRMGAVARELTDGES